MKALTDIVQDLVQQWSVAPAPTIRVSGLVEDSRQVQPGNGYLAVAGSTHDGHDFVQAAVTSGAVAVLAERPTQPLPVPVGVVPELAQHRSVLASRAYDEPSHQLNCVGITGTNGKTSVAHYLAQLLGLLGESCGYLGTLGWGQLPDLREAALTTADACAVQQRLATLRAQGCQHVALEVSSHALVQHRVAGVEFDSALFTNLSRDHLDYHGSMQAYAQAKQRLFAMPSVECIVTNVDDACGRAIGERYANQDSSARVFTYGSVAAAVSWRDIQVHESGFTGRWHTAWGDAPLQLPLLGRFAIANVAAALTLLLSRGWPLQDLAVACARLQTVPGRMQYLANSRGANVVVDFAHTPDALVQALTSLREHCAGKQFVVFGCGGDRDRGKRAEMGRAVASTADAMWLTDDNPRSEDPAQIIADIQTGIPASANAYVQHSRHLAIEAALAASSPNDLVLVAGKGHETYQERDGVKHHYSDLDTVTALLKTTVQEQG